MHDNTNSSYCIIFLTLNWPGCFTPVKSSCISQRKGKHSTGKLWRCKLLGQLYTPVCFLLFLPGESVYSFIQANARQILSAKGEGLVGAWWSRRQCVNYSNHSFSDYVEEMRTLLFSMSAADISALQTVTEKYSAKTPPPLTAQFSERKSKDEAIKAHEEKKRRISAELYPAGKYHWCTT